MSLESHSAPGANAGFSFQFERALNWLAKSPSGSVIGIETDDDVSVRTSSGGQVLEQDKHSIQEKGEPFGDRSKDLWNTLAIWVEAINTKEVDPATTAFLMVTNKSLPDCVARKISEAETDADVADCIAALEAAGDQPSKTIKDLVEKVLHPSSRTSLRCVVANCTLTDASSSIGEETLRKETIGHLQLPQWCTELADSITNELLGWLHHTVLGIWQKNCPAWIPRDNFINQLHAIISRRKRELTRERAAHLIQLSDEAVAKEKGQPFVKQLHLVTDDDDIVDTAIRECLRCNIEKIRLSEEGNITDEDWLTFQGNLVERWKKIRGRVMRMKAANPEEDVGFEIFCETTENYREKLAGIDTEQVYLTSGTYHRLAGLLQLGWHPRYQEMMQDFRRAS